MNSQVLNLKRLIEMQLLGVGYWTHEAARQGRRHPAIQAFLVDALASICPGVNDDPERLLTLVQMAEAARQTARDMAGGGEPAPEPALFALTQEIVDLVFNGAEIRVFAHVADEDRWPALRESMAGLQTQAVEAGLIRSLNGEETGIDGHAAEALHDLCQPDPVGGLSNPLASALDRAKVARFGEPEAVSVPTDWPEGPVIVVSGRDFQVLEDVLVQTFQRDISVLTHGALRVAHAYPGFRQFGHLAGHVENLPSSGVFVLTPGYESSLLSLPKSRLFTTGLVGLPGAVHVTDAGYRDVIQAVGDWPS